MTASLVVFDLFFVLLATLLYGGAILAGARVYSALASHVPWPLAVVPSIYAALLVLVAEVSLCSALCPRLREGRFRMMKDMVFFSWSFRMLLRRAVSVPGVKFLLFSSNVLRFFVLRGLGARVAFSTNMSSDVDILDPALLTVGAGATLGAHTLITGHYFERGTLVLGEVHVGEGALLAFEVACAPGVRVGPGATIKSRASLSVNVVVGDGAVVGGGAALDSGVLIGARARVANAAVVLKGTEVADGDIYPASKDAQGRAA